MRPACPLLLALALLAGCGNGSSSAPAPIPPGVFESLSREKVQALVEKHKILLPRLEPTDQLAEVPANAVVIGLYHAPADCAHLQRGACAMPDHWKMVTQEGKEGPTEAKVFAERLGRKTPRDLHLRPLVILAADERAPLPSVLAICRTMGMWSFALSARAGGSARFWIFGDGSLRGRKPTKYEIEEARRKLRMAKDQEIEAIRKEFLGGVRLNLQAEVGEDHRNRWEEKAGESFATTRDLIAKIRESAAACAEPYNLHVVTIVPDEVPFPEWAGVVAATHAVGGRAVLRYADQ